MPTDSRDYLLSARTVSAVDGRSRFACSGGINSNARKIKTIILQAGREDETVARR
jgi:hypothetical protein